MTKVSIPYNFLILHFLHLSADLFLAALAYKCDEDAYYKPYVVVKKKRNGGELATLRSSGFLDLRFRNRVILCINGPAVLYPNVERLDPDTIPISSRDQSKDALRSNPDARHPGPDHGITDNDDEELRFRNGELRVFNHDCISVNRVPTALLKKMKVDQGRRFPELQPDTQVAGKLVLGIFLIGNKESLKEPELAWFKGRDFDYIKTKDRTVKDASFLFTNGNGAHCVRLPDGTQIKIHYPKKEENNGHLVCEWRMRENYPKHLYSFMFQRGFDENGVHNGEQTLQESDYAFYPCPEIDPDSAIILTMSQTTPPPVTHANYTEFDPFALFNPNLWTPHGYRKDSNGISGGDERSEDRGTFFGTGAGNGIACSVEPTNPSCMESGDMEATTLGDMQNVDAPDSHSFIQLEASNCTALPFYDNTSCSYAGRYGHRLLELVLELEPDFISGDPIVPGVPANDFQRMESPKYMSLNDNSSLEWKFDFLYLTAEIFNQLCMPFKPEMAYQVARVFAWYVYKGHLFGENMGWYPTPDPDAPEEYGLLNAEYDSKVEKADYWPIIFKEFERCNSMAKNENGGKGLKFQWETGDDSGKYKIPAVDGRSTRRRKRSTRYRNSMEKEAKNDNDIEDIDAETGEKLLSRQKRAESYKINGSAISTKYILPGKSLAVVKSEGTWGFAREAIQEYKKKLDLNDPRADAQKYWDYPENIQHCWNPQEDPSSKKVVCSKTEDLFFYEDRVEVASELNIAIDMWWKIFSTVLGYCNKAYYSRKSETFPKIYLNMYEYYFDLVEKEWLTPEDNDDLRVILSEYLTEESQIWMDACLEAAYVNSNSQSFRPPRPLVFPDGPNAELISNYFEEIPSQIYYRYHPEPTGGM